MRESLFSAGTVCRFPPSPSLLTINDRDARLLLVALMLEFARMYQEVGIMQRRPTWALAAILYRLCRKGMARITFGEDKFHIELAPGLEAFKIH